MKRLTSPDYRYDTAEDSRKPGYLARKFAAIRKRMDAEQKEREAAEAETAKVVKQIRKAK